jgi:hypothetical protein
MVFLKRFTLLRNLTCKRHLHAQCNVSFINIPEVQRQGQSLQSNLMYVVT